MLYGRLPSTAFSTVNLTWTRTRGAALSCSVVMLGTVAVRFQVVTHEALSATVEAQLTNAEANPTVAKLKVVSPPPCAPTPIPSQKRRMG